MSLVQTIGKTLVPVHREGWPFVGAFAVATLILGWLWAPLFWPCLFLTAWCAYFFRDPQRVTPLDDDLVISPADGRVSAVSPVVPPAELGLGDAPMMRISIFMNVFSVHINRAPARGEVSTVAYRPGRFLNADLDKASAENERNGIVIETAHGRLGVVQVAGLVARRILCWVKQGDETAAGARFGMIRFGSRLDVYLPDGAVPRVFVGQTTNAGETVIADYRPRAVRPPSRTS